MISVVLPSNKAAPRYRSAKFSRICHSRNFVRVLLLIALAVILYNVTAHRKLKIIPKKSQTASVICASVTAGDEFRSAKQRTVLKYDGYIRNCVSGRVLGRLPLGGAWQTELISAVNNSATEDADTRRRVFKKVFEKRIWRHLDNVYKGPVVSGSPLYTTMEVMAQLHVIIEHLKIRYGLSRVRLLDVPCGDMLWMSQFLATRDDIDYMGIDIVPELINSHRKLFADRPTWKFHVVDIVRDGVGNWSTADGGDGNYDLVLSRRMLQHLMLSDVMAVLGHLSAIRTGDVDRPAHLLISTFAHESENSQLKSGDVKRFQPLNLLIPPISLVPPLCLGRDYAHTVVSYIGLWSLPVRRVINCDGKKSLKTKADGILQEMYSCVNWTWNRPTRFTR